MITKEQVDAVCAELQRGASYRKACKLASINVKALRWERYGDPAVMRRCAAARATGLQAKAAKIEARAHAMLARVQKLRAEASKHVTIYVGF